MDLVLAHAMGLDEPATKLKKAGVACLEITKFSPLRTTLQWLATPGMLRKMKREPHAEIPRPALWRRQMRQ